MTIRIANIKAGDRWCNATHKNGHVCTREKGHKGAHVAHAYPDNKWHQVLKTWRTE